MQPALAANLALVTKKNDETPISQGYGGCMRRVFLFCFAAFLFFSVHQASAATLNVDGSQQFQTIDGFGVNVNTGWWNNGEVKPAIDMLVDQLGANIFRAVIEESDWESTNDDANPNNFNWTYYNALF